MRDKLTVQGVPGGQRNRMRARIRSGRALQLRWSLKGALLESIVHADPCLKHFLREVGLVCERLTYGRCNWRIGATEVVIKEFAHERHMLGQLVLEAPTDHPAAFGRVDRSGMRLATASRRAFASLGPCQGPSTGSIEKGLAVPCPTNPPAERGHPIDFGGNEWIANSPANQRVSRAQVGPAPVGGDTDNNIINLPVVSPLETRCGADGLKRTVIKRAKRARGVRTFPVPGRSRIYRTRDGLGVKLGNAHVAAKIEARPA